MNTLNNQLHATAVMTNLEVLRFRLTIAAASVEQACAAMAAGHQNLAIGSIFDLKETLPECDALLRATFVLHRMRAPNVQEGGAQ